MTETAIKPDIRILKQDVTRFIIDNALLRKVGKVFEVFIYDANRHVHLCELSPSYELHFVEFQPINMPDDEDEREYVYQVLEDIAAESPRNVEYSRVKGIDKIPEVEEVKSRLMNVDGDHRARLTHLYGNNWGDDAFADAEEPTAEELHNAAIEEALEYVRGNGC